jgi:hypothetical protein
MKSKIELGIVAFLIVGLLAYIIFRNDNNINYNLPKMEKISRDSVSKITYNDFEITKSNGEWFLPSGYKAQKVSIDRLLAETENLRVIDMISESKNYSRFGLEEADTLKIYKNDQVLLDIKVGNTSKTGNYTYVLILGQSQVYSIRGNIKNTFNKTENDLRDKTVFTVTKDQITEIVITRGDKVINLTPEQIEEISPTIANITASNFNNLNSGEVLLTMEVKGETNKTFTIYNKVGEEYPGGSTDVDFPFTVPSWIVSKLEAIE